MKDSQAIVTPLGVSDASIKLDSPEWFDWLSERSSFSYQSAISDYTCNKRSNGKWYASKRKGDRSQGSKSLAQEYLGSGDKVTKPKLEEIARKFALPDRDYWYLKHPKPKTGEPTASPGAGCTTDKGTTKKEGTSQLSNSVTRWNVYERAKGWDSKQKAYAWSEWQWCGSWETEAKADSQIETRKEHNHRKNSMSDYGVLPMEWEKRLEVIAPADSSQQSHSNDDYATDREISSQTADEIAELKAEVERLKNRETYLLDQLGLVKTKIIHESQTEAEALRTQLNQTDKYNMELERNYNILNEMWRKSEQQRCEFQAQLNECQAHQQPSIDAATLFNQLRPLLNRLSDRDRRAIQQKIEEIVD